MDKIIMNKHYKLSNLMYATIGLVIFVVMFKTNQTQSSKLLIFWILVFLVILIAILHSTLKLLRLPYCKVAELNHNTLTIFKYNKKLSIKHEIKIKDISKIKLRPSLLINSMQFNLDIYINNKTITISDLASGAFIFSKEKMNYPIFRLYFTLKEAMDNLNLKN